MCATYHTETASTSDLALNSQSIIGLTLSTATTATISVTPLNFSCASAHRCTVMLGMITPYTLLPECKNKWRIRIGRGRTRLRPYGIPYGGCGGIVGDRKSTRLNSSHRCISYAVFCLKK